MNKTYKIKALLLDDEEFIREIFQDYLEDYGIECESFASGFSALEGLKSSQSKFDLIVSDIIMPEMDGIEFLKKINETIDYKPSFVFITGGVKIESASSTADLEKLIDGYLEKPFKRKELEELLESLFKAA
ncbi:MAG: response regulator [Bdellovibrionales bacterium]